VTIRSIGAALCFLIIVGNAAQAANNSELIGTWKRVDENGRTLGYLAIDGNLGARYGNGELGHVEWLGPYMLRTYSRNLNDPIPGGTAGTRICDWRLLFTVSNGVPVMTWYHQGTDPESEKWHPPSPQCLAVRYYWRMSGGADGLIVKRPSRSRNCACSRRPPPISARLQKPCQGRFQNHHPAGCGNQHRSDRSRAMPRA
jgi:hypothetical protein